MSLDGIALRWMRFEDVEAELMALRRAVFIDEQGLTEAEVADPTDAEGVHLCAFADGELVAAVSAYVFEDPDDEGVTEWGLAPSRGPVVRFTKRVTTPAFRGRGLSALLLAGLFHAAHEVVRPCAAFFVLKGPHRAMSDALARLSGLPAEARGDVLLHAARTLSDCDRQMRLARDQIERSVSKTGLALPSLTRHLLERGLGRWLGAERLAGENLYTETLNLRDELPRLTAQERILFGYQRHHLVQAGLPPGPATLVDLGCGPGSYLAMMARMPELAGYTLIGVDQCPQMIAQGRLERPGLAWHQASAYTLPLADRSVDVVHASFLFINLRSPDLALAEIARVLKPGGIFYVVDVHDPTFQGPPEILALVAAYHAGNNASRRIMAELPARAASWGFTLTRTAATPLVNDLPETGVEVHPDRVRMGRMNLWGLLSFFGQPEALEEPFERAREVYLRGEDEVQVSVLTQVYRLGAP
ncbi:MAG: class I SAM-dependent methyltransferase [Alphaproteobacteria bacterium]|nr:class I SAM-dependent methyltransferase [Alphaproteobacteria bacterium]